MHGVKEYAVYTSRPTFGGGRVNSRANKRLRAEDKKAIQRKAAEIVATGKMDGLPPVNQGVFGRPVIRKFLFDQCCDFMRKTYGGESRKARRAMARALSKRNRTKISKTEMQNLYRGAVGLAPLMMELP